MAYTEETKEQTFESIIAEIENGRSLRQTLQLEDMPSSSTFFKWLDDDELKSKRYARAREIRAEGILDEMFEIADDGSNDYMTITKGDIEYNVEDREVTSRSKLRIDTRKWALSKMNPKRFGDRTDITSGGKPLQPTAPSIIQVEIIQPNEEED